MIRFIPKYSVLILAFCVSQLCYSQFEGIVLYEMTYSSSDPNTRPYIDMLPKKSTLYVKGGQMRLDQPIAGGGSQSFITNLEANTSTLVMLLMGQKFQVTMNAEEMQQLEKIQKLKIIEGSKTKVIHGNVCQQAFALSGNDSLEIYYAPNLKTRCILPQLSDLKGLPLEYEILNDHIRIKYVCNNISEETVQNAVFEVGDEILKIPFDQFAHSFAIAKTPTIEGR